MLKFLKAIEAIKEPLLDLVYPRQDLWTEQPLEWDRCNGKYLKQSSYNYLNFIHDPVCGVCGFPLFGKTDGSESCQQCTHLQPVFKSNRSVLLMNQLGRRIIHEIKYHDGKYLFEDLCLILESSSVLSEKVEGHILVPVPLHPRKLRERGFNQSELIAKAFLEVFGNNQTQIMQMLKRDEDTNSQTMKDRSERVQNVKNAFSLSLGPMKIQKDSPITIVDDVFTTGSTVNECAKVMHNAGYHNLHVLTLGHG